MTRKYQKPGFWRRLQFACWRLWRRDLVSFVDSRKAKRLSRVSPALLVVLRRDELRDAIAALEHAQFEAGREAMRRELTESPVGALARELAKDLEVDWPPPVKPYAHG